MIVYDAKGKIISLGDSIGRGGEAVVYAIRGQPGRLAKIYQTAPRPEYPAKLAWMVAHPPEDPASANGHASLAWPDGLVFDARRQLVGYCMTHLRNAVPIIDVFNPRRRSKILPGFNRRYLHRTARNLSAALGALHRAGYVVGDLNESNVMVTPSALVALIDTDSFQVVESQRGKEIVYRCPVGKVEYTPPELQNKSPENVLRRPEHDLFALGTLVFQLLMEGSHPFRSQWLEGGDPPPVEVKISRGLFPYGGESHAPVRPPKNLPGLDALHPALAEMMLRCFVEGHANPELRPSPADWERALAEAEACLIPCPQGHFHDVHSSACPYCAVPGARPTSSRRGASSRVRSRPERQKAASSQARPRQGAPAVRPNAMQWARKAYQVWQWSQGNRSAAPAWLWPGIPSSTGQSPAVTPSPSRTGGQAPRQASPSLAPAPRPSAPLSSPPSGSAASTQTWPLWPSNSGTFFPRPAFQQVGFWNWARPRIARSLLVGGGYGLLAGAILAALINLAAGSLGQAAAWGLLCSLGGAAAGVLRGWKPGYRLSLWVEQSVGWQRVLQGFGLLAGALGGGLFGFVIGWWAVIPIFIGLFLGAKKGVLLGSKIWSAGTRYGWDRIWSILGAVGSGAAGWLILSWISAGSLGGFFQQYTGEAVLWLAQSVESSPILEWALTGALAGAFGGAVAGTLSDLSSRLAGLLD